MDQGVISNFKSYYLRRTFCQLIEKNENPESMKILWKNYSILKTIDNIAYALKEIKPSCMRGIWRPLQMK